MPLLTQQTYTLAANKEKDMPPKVIARRITCGFNYSFALKVLQTLIILFKIDFKKLPKMVVPCSTSGLFPQRT